MKQLSFAPGQRVVIRDAEWIIKDVERSSYRGVCLSVTGLSSIVRDVEARFLSDLEDNITILNPVDTKLVQDVSGNFADTRLYLDTLLRDTPSHGAQVIHGTRGAMDLIPYQVDPARMALSEPRSRILIADAVGLGKTIECGILLTELIARGRGKRILVVALSSMLTQFQKELWSRFSIPLVRLDSAGITRVKNRIPANYNPFYYYDKTIISVDTLKRDVDYRPLLEKSWWDIIVIDEAQNVARRSNHSQRSKLAERLADRCDSLVMLSATPHDGRKESFASLMTMLNPAAIDENDYGPEDIKGMFIRRFKKDIKDQVTEAFPERTITRHLCAATEEEQEILLFLKSMRYAEMVNHGRSGKLLFRTVLEKSFLSSPRACLATVSNRINKLMNRTDISNQVTEISELKDLRDLLSRLPDNRHSKLNELIKLLQSSSYGWKPKDTRDRVVIFTERIETLKYLKEQILASGFLKEKQIATLYGSSSDIEIQQTVEDFGKESSPIRLMIASDIASEGINLHYLSHRLIHFDIPWSLMTFQQRNGRIDRYGQHEVPNITYLLSDFSDDKLRGDRRILELLIEKDDQVQKNIGGPGEFAIFDSEEEEYRIGQAIEAGETPESVVASIEASGDDFFTAFFEGIEPISSRIEKESSPPRIFAKDEVYYLRLLNALKDRRQLQFESHDDGQTITITPPKGFMTRQKLIPSEAWPDGSYSWLFTPDRARVMADIAEARKEERLWPRENLLWDFHPMLQWLRDDALTSYGRQEAPVAAVPTLKKNEVLILYRGFIPNRQGQIVVHSWGGLLFRDGDFQDFWTIEDTIKHLKLTEDRIPNAAGPIDAVAITKLFPAALIEAGKAIRQAREDFNTETAPVLKEQMEKLGAIRDRKVRQLDLAFKERGESSSHLVKSRFEREKDKARQDYSNYIKWIEDHLQTQDEGYTPIIVAFVGDGYDYPGGSR